MSTNRTIKIGGDASGAMDAFESIKEVGKDMFDAHSKAAEQYTSKITKQAERVAFLIEKEKELARERLQSSRQNAAIAREAAMNKIKRGGYDSTDPTGIRRKKQAQDEYNKSIREANQDFKEYSKSIDEASRLNKQRQEGNNTKAAGGRGRAMGGAVMGGVAGFMSGSGIGALASSVVGGGIGMLPFVGEGLGMIGGGVTGALFTQGEKLAKAREGLMALTGKERFSYTKKGYGREGYKSRVIDLAKRESGEIYDISKERSDIKKRLSTEIYRQKLAKDRKVNFKRKIQPILEDKAENDTRMKNEKDKIDKKIKELREGIADKHLIGYRPTVGTPSVSYLGMDRASVAERQIQLAKGAGTRKAAMAGETAQILRFEKGMGIGQGALQGWSDMQGSGLQSKTGDMMSQFLTLATKSKLWDVDKRDFSAIPREIKTMTALMQAQTQSMVRPDAQQAMALRAQFAQLDEDKTTGLFSGARGQGLMMGINQAIQNPANAFQSAMTLQSIMKANPEIGGGAVGLMKARAIQQRGLFHGGGSTFQSMLDDIKSQTPDTGMRDVLFTTRFKQFLPYIMDKEGKAAIHKMYETDFSTGDMADNLKKVGFSEEILKKLKIGTGTSQTEKLNTKIVDKLQTVGTNITESVSGSIIKMIDFMGGDTMAKNISKGIKLASAFDADNPKPKDDTE